MWRIAKSCRARYAAEQSFSQRVTARPTTHPRRACPATSPSPQRTVCYGRLPRQTRAETSAEPRSDLATVRPACTHSHRRGSLRRALRAAMDDEAIAAMAMCGMVGGPASGGPALRTAVGEMTLGMSLEVRYRSTDDDGDGGFYRAKVSAIGDESIQVTYPETQVPRRPAPVARSAVAKRGCMSAQEWHESTEDIPIAELTGARVRLPPSAAPAAAGGAWRRKDGSPEMWQASSPVEQDAPDSPRAVLRTSETLPPRRSSGGRPRRPVKRGAASGVVEAQAKAKRSRLKSVDVITTADTPFPGWTMERRKTWREKCSPPTPRSVGGPGG